LGVENFSDAVLEENGRAHLSGEVYKAWDWIQDVGFPNVNIDLIAGMVGETWENWQDNIRRTIELSPDSVTINQLELPFKTVY
jgi:oxygen-independent coproporphyrinogen-3 oxidase